jgi:addiction module HigA family antidote
MARAGERMHPGRVLREEYMAPMRLSAEGLASALDVPPAQVAALIAGKRPPAITSDFALRLARYFRTSPHFWLSLQAAHDLSIAQARFGAEIAARVQPMMAA